MINNRNTCKNTFSELAIESLKYIKYCDTAIILLYIIGLILLGFQSILHPSIAIIGVTIIFAASTVALFVDVLQELLKNALEIKSENDLTV